jgi:preprotein translocase subunit SecD
MRRGLVPMLFTVLLTAVLVVYTLLSGNAPFLGLDLQGGVAVVLQPEGEATDEQLDDAVAIIRSRVDAIGVAEPEITRQGQNISVEIPGVSNRQQAIDLVGQTGELAFRPVLNEAQTGFEVDADGNIVFNTETRVEEGDGTTIEGDGTEGDGSGGSTDTVPGDAVDPATDTTVDGTSTEGGWSGGFVAGESAAATQDPAVDPSVPVTVGDPAADATATTIDPAAIAQQTGAPELTGDTGPSDVVVLAQYRNADGKRYEVGRYQLGPASLSGAGLEGASASLDQRGQWVVRPSFKGGQEGIDAFNKTASQCFARSPECPTGLFAITLDGEVISALGVQAASFARDDIVISGGFTEQSSKDLATVLRYGALPVELSIQSVQEVSATLGRDALEAGVVAGLIGLALVALYMMVFYRLLGVAAVVKLGLELGMLWAIISWLGTSQGLALTLAGVTGIVVSIGVSVDSNVVFYEAIKEDVRKGRSLRSAADKSFTPAWRTIVKADVASLIAAVLLYALAVGPVRGFAFYLGLSTLLDLFASWFFMRPTVSLSLRSKLAQRRPRLFGMPGAEPAGGAPGRDVPPATTPDTVEVRS